MKAHTMTREAAPGATVQAKQSPTIATLAICVVGIYISFITWSVLQEKISTTGYGPEAVVFKAPLVVNVVQAFFACVVGSVYLSFKQGAVTAPWAVFYGSKGALDTTVLKYFTVISVTQSISSPLGVASLGHVSYLVFLLAKSCKLIPVMMVQFLVFGRRFPAHKYAVASMITLGVSMFTVFKSAANAGSTKEVDDGKLVLGLGYLLASMFLDGVTNSTQDALFGSDLHGFKLTGGHLMAGLNLLNCVISLVYTVVATHQLSYSWQFIRAYPEALHNVVLFGVFGSLGQIFIFITLEKFDSIVLVTVTVTRKMFSMLLSVAIFGHVLNWMQWVGVSLVFGGIALEAWLKNRLSTPKLKKA